METTDAFIAKAVNMSMNLIELDDMPSVLASALSTLTAANIEPYVTEEKEATTSEVVAEETVATIPEAVGEETVMAVLMVLT